MQTASKASAATNLKPFMLFAPVFHKWPLALIRHMRGQLPDMQFSGVTTGGKLVYRQVVADETARSARIDDLEDLEALWLETPVTEETKRDVHSVFSNADISRILISDRHVGWRYISGVVLAMSPLMEACTSDKAIERYVYNLCKWIIDFHRSTEFNACICYAVAGAPAAAIAYFCKNKDIPFVSISHSLVGNLYFMDSYPVNCLNTISKKFKCFSERVKSADKSIRFARSYLDDFRERPQQPDWASGNYQKLIKTVSMKSLVRNFAFDLYTALRALRGSESSYLRRPPGLERLRHNLTVGLRARKHFKCWRHHVMSDIGDNEFIYYPLHVNPEASTMVWAPMFTDQIAIIEALSKVTPLGMKLVVKEHLPMLGLRPPGFYEAIARLPNIVLLSPTVNSLELISGARLVCAITGTAVWESLLLGTPALLFGDAPFDILDEGLFKCTDLALLPEVADEALSSPRASDDHLIAYLAAIHSEGFEFDFWSGSPSDLDTRELNAISELVGNNILTALRN